MLISPRFLGMNVGIIKVKNITSRAKTIKSCLMVNKVPYSCKSSVDDFSTLKKEKRKNKKDLVKKHPGISDCIYIYQAIFVQ
jgi:hypothetical protein